MGRLSRARYVQHPRNAGWPEGREPHGHGVSVVVRGRESRPHGEGRQVVGRPRRRGTRDAKRRNGPGNHQRTWQTKAAAGGHLSLLPSVGGSSPAPGYTASCKAAARRGNNSAGREGGRPSFSYVMAETSPHPEPGHISNGLRPEDPLKGSGRKRTKCSAIRKLYSDI